MLNLIFVNFLFLSGQLVEDWSRVMWYIHFVFTYKSFKVICDLFSLSGNVFSGKHTTYWLIVALGLNINQINFYVRWENLEINYNSGVDNSNSDRLLRIRWSSVAYVFKVVDLSLDKFYI